MLARELPMSSIKRQSYTYQALLHSGDCRAETIPLVPHTAGNAFPVNRDSLVRHAMPKENLMRWQFHIWNKRWRIKPALLVAVILLRT